MQQNKYNPEDLVDYNSTYVVTAQPQDVEEHDRQCYELQQSYLSFLLESGYCPRIAAWKAANEIEYGFSGIIE